MVVRVIGVKVESITYSRAIDVDSTALATFTSELVTMVGECDPDKPPGYLDKNEYTSLQGTSMAPLVL